MKINGGRWVVGALVLWLGVIAFAQEAFQSLVNGVVPDLAVIRRRAEAGDVPAQIQLGNSLAENFRPASALEWYRKTAKAGNLEGAYRTGHLLLFGAVGIPKEQGVQAYPFEGLRWTLRAATNGHPMACLDMSRVRLRGIGMNTNHVEAYAWLKLYAKSPGGSIVGQAEANALVMKMNAIEADIARQQAAAFEAGQFTIPIIRAVPDNDPRLKLHTIMDGDPPFAVIGGKQFAQGATVSIPNNPMPLLVKCLKLEKDTVTIQVEGEDAPRVLQLKP